MKNPANILQVIAGWLVSNVEAILIMCTPLLSALPSMFAAIRALEKGGWKQANLIGGIIEALGLTSGAFMGYIEGHNQRHPEQPISRWWGYGVFVFYLIVVEALIITHTPDPVSILLPGLTVIGSVIVGFRRLMLRADEKQGAKDKVVGQRDEAQFQFDMEMKRREAEQRLEIERAEAEHRMSIERQKVDAKLSKSVQKPVQMDTSTSGNGQLDTPKAPGDVDTMLDIYRQNPKASLRSVGGKLGRSPQTISNWLDSLESQGTVHRNGAGVEVLP
jgi:hypothetical protein